MKKSTDIKGGDTLISCTIATKDRLRDLPTKGKTYNEQLNELMDFWEKNQKK